MKEAVAPYVHTNLITHHPLPNRRSCGLSHDTQRMSGPNVYSYGVSTLLVSDQRPKNTSAYGVSKPAGADARQEAGHASAQW